MTYPGNPGPYGGPSSPPPPPVATPDPNSGSRKTAVIVAASVGVTAALLGGGILTGKSLSNNPAPVASSDQQQRSPQKEGEQDSGRCFPTTGIETTPIERRSSTEPVVALPTPPGWIVDRSGLATTNPVTRDVFAAPHLSARGFTPNAVVTVQEMAGRFAGLSTEEVFGSEISSLQALGFRVEKAQWGTICGFPSATAKWTKDQNSGVVLIVVATDPRSGTRWDITCTVQTRDPQNFRYISDRRMILDRIQIGFPPSSP